MKKNKSSAPSSLHNKKQLVARLKELLAKAESLVEAAAQNAQRKKPSKPVAKRAAKAPATPKKKVATKKSSRR